MPNFAAIVARARKARATQLHGHQLRAHISSNGNMMGMAMGMGMTMAMAMGMAMGMAMET